MISTIKRIAHSIVVRVFPSRMGYVIKPTGEGYFNAKVVVKLAKEKGLSVTDFLETSNYGGVGKRRDEIIEKLASLHVLKPCSRIVEIGAGTGMYLEKFIEHCKPKSYHVYETNVSWTSYLKQEYATATNLEVPIATGHSLHITSDQSADIVAAHGVFVYLPVVLTVQYLQEAARVCKQNGLLIFDCFSDRIFNLAEIVNFRKNNPYYDFPVIIKEQLVDEICDQWGFKKLHSFDTNYHYTKTTYFILQKL